MTLSQLKKIIKQGECEILEFKRSTAQIQAAMQTICAFLNNEIGGTVLIGVTDNGKIVGQVVSDSTRKEIASEMRKFEPNADIDIEYISVYEKHFVIKFSTQKNLMAPYVHDGRPFDRNQSTTQKMSQEKYINMLHNRSHSPVSWDRLAANDCTIKDLDVQRIKQVVHTGVAEGRLTAEALHASTNEILKKFELLSGEKLVNAAVVLFCKNEHKQFMQSNVKLARFRGLDKSEFIDEKALRGNIFDLFDQAMKFLRNYLPIGARIEEGNPLRVTSHAIPQKVLREALINAFCHKDYSLPGGSVTVAIYDDRVEITSSGKLPLAIKLKDLKKKHESHPRNKLIANVLFACHMIEQWGRGTQDMIKFCKESGNTVPKFEEISSTVWVTMPLKEPILSEAMHKVPAFSLTDRQKEIMDILGQGPLKRSQITERMKNPPTDKTIKRELSTLRELGFITSEGVSRAVVWIIKCK